jgi:hypothetical protein
MSNYYLSKNNINLQSERLEQLLKIKSPEAKEKCKLLITEQMRQINEKYGKNIPNNLPDAKKYIAKMNDKSIIECKRLIGNRAPPKYSTSEINKYERDRDAEVYADRQLNVTKRPGYTSASLQSKDDDNYYKYDKRKPKPNSRSNAKRPSQPKGREMISSTGETIYIEDEFVNMIGIKTNDKKGSDRLDELLAKKTANSGYMGKNMMMRQPTKNHNNNNGNGNEGLTPALDQFFDPEQQEAGENGFGYYSEDGDYGSIGNLGDVDYNSKINNNDYDRMISERANITVNTTGKFDPSISPNINQNVGNLLNQNFDVDNRGNVNFNGKQQADLEHEQTKKAAYEAYLYAMNNDAGRNPNGIGNKVNSESIGNTNAVNNNVNMGNNGINGMNGMSNNRTNNMANNNGMTNNNMRNNNMNNGMANNNMSNMGNNNMMNNNGMTNSNMRNNTGMINSNMMNNNGMTNSNMRNNTGMINSNMMNNNGMANNNISNMGNNNMNSRGNNSVNNVMVNNNMNSRGNNSVNNGMVNNNMNSRGNNNTNNGMGNNNTNNGMNSMNNGMVNNNMNSKMNSMNNGMVNNNMNSKMNSMNNGMVNNNMNSKMNSMNNGMVNNNMNSKMNSMNNGMINNNINSGIVNNNMNNRMVNNNMNSKVNNMNNMGYNNVNNLGNRMNNDINNASQKNPNFFLPNKDVNYLDKYISQLESKLKAKNTISNVIDLSIFNSSPTDENTLGNKYSNYDILKNIEFDQVVNNTSLFNNMSLKVPNQLSNNLYNDVINNWNNNSENYIDNINNNDNNATDNYENNYIYNYDDVDSNSHINDDVDNNYNTTNDANIADVNNNNDYDIDNNYNTANDSNITDVNNNNGYDDPYDTPPIITKTYEQRSAIPKRIKITKKKEDLPKILSINSSEYSRSNNNYLVEFPITHNITNVSIADFAHPFIPEDIEYKFTYFINNNQYDINMHYDEHTIDNLVKQMNSNVNVVITDNEIVFEINDSDIEFKIDTTSDIYKLLSITYNILVNDITINKLCDSYTIYIDIGDTNDLILGKMCNGSLIKTNIPCENITSKFIVIKCKTDDGEDVDFKGFPHHITVKIN